MGKGISVKEYLMDQPVALAAVSVGCGAQGCGEDGGRADETQKGCTSVHRFAVSGW
jgi:hypothetical protein